MTVALDELRRGTCHLERARYDQGIPRERSLDAFSH
jgi:hypothetical protein